MACVIQFELPSGDVVTQVELSTRVDDRSVSVPVAVHGVEPAVTTGDDVVVTGHVIRRFFRVAGVTQSRTEVVSARVVKASRRRTVERAVTEIVDLLAGPASSD